MKILFITGKAERCGIADYGKRLFAILQPHFDITICEADKAGDINFDGYDIALYNYHYATLPFVKADNKSVKHIALFHEAFMNFTPDVIVNVCDLPRPLFEGLDLPQLKNNLPVIGSFGFAVGDKNFPGLCQMVKDQFDKAVVRLNIPFAQYGDADGTLARNEIDKCQKILDNGKVCLLFDHKFLSHTELIRFLAVNDVNIFNYAETCGRGLSSCIDYALSVNKPIGISKSEMFKHLPREICLDNITIPELIIKGTDPLKQMYEENSNARFIEKIKSILYD